jgi:hypothetical protein
MNAPGMRLEDLLFIAGSFCHKDSFEDEKRWDEASAMFWEQAVLEEIFALAIAKKTELLFGRPLTTVETDRFGHKSAPTRTVRLSHRARRDLAKAAAEARRDTNR